MTLHYSELYPTHILTLILILILTLTVGLLFSAPGLGKFISGSILYEETLFQNHADGTPFVDLLKKQGIFPGIKVDTGLQPLPGADPIETW
jgi:fructose-bisphosphate aldolase class I